MQITSICTSTYHGTNNTWTLTVKNNEGDKRQIDSVTIKMGTGSGYFAGTCQYTGNGSPVNVYLTGGGCTSDTVSVTKVCPASRGAPENWVGSGPSDPRDISAYTITFPDGNKPQVNNGASITFTVHHNASNSNHKILVHSRKINTYSCSASPIVPPTPPYTASRINSSSKDVDIIRAGVTKFHVNFNVSAGNEMWNTEVKCFTWDSTGTVSFGTTQLHRTRDCKEKQNTTFDESFEIVAGELAHGSRYKMAAIVADVDRAQSPEHRYGVIGSPSDNIQSCWSLYTYQEPKLDSGTVNIGEKHANTDYTFSFTGTNNRAWTSYESEFQTRYRISFDNGSTWSGWSNAGNVTSWYRTAAEMRSLFPKAQDGKYARIQFKRYSPSAPDSSDTDTNHSNNKGWYSDNTKEYTITLKYRPRNEITCPNIMHKKNNSSGASIGKDAFVENNSTLTGIYVYWNYDTTVANAGYVQGYRIRLYNTSGTVVHTYYTNNKYYTIPKSDIPKMQHTYIDVTPYFANDQPHAASSTYAGNYWYYNGTITKCPFVVMASKLAKPVITYPVNGSDWINNRFRVCFQLPTDGDKGSEIETYHYEEIELKINGTHTYRMTANPEGKTTTGTCLQAAGVFSALPENLTYQRKIVMAPCLASNFPNTNQYTIQVRVKKKYTEDKINWSDWSDTVTIKITPATFNPARGDIIYASHYNNAKKTIDRVRKTYRSCLDNTTSRCSSKSNQNIKNSISICKLV